VPPDPQTWTVKTREIVEAAFRRANEAHHVEMEPEHLALALLSQTDGLGPRLLEKAGLKPAAIRVAISDEVGRLPHRFDDAEVLTSKRTLRVFDAAEAIKGRLGDDLLSVEHLTLALAGVLGADETKLEMAAKALRSETEQTDGSEGADESLGLLERYGRDLTAVARRGLLDPVIGRDEEIRRVVEVLSRRSKNNPVLIGEPGVGKTAVAEGLAQRIVAGDVPRTLADRRLVALDMASMVAGAKYRGEFEERLKGVVDALVASAGEVIAFIDEIHTVVGAGAAEGAMDAANQLKPMLARGEIRVLGATTLDEYRRYIEADPALERRFQRVLVKPPTVAEAVTILRGLKDRYEVHHGVQIGDEALVAAATLSDRYVTGRFLPDKAIDLIDEAASRRRIELDSMPSELDALQRRIRQVELERLTVSSERNAASRERLAALEAELAQLQEQAMEMSARWQQERESISTVQRLKEELELSRQRADVLERNGEVSKAAELRVHRIPELEQWVESATAELDRLQSGGKMLKQEVDAEDVAEVISRWTGVPASRLMAGEVEKLVQLESELQARVIGQDAAVVAVANAIRRSRAGLADPHRPIGSFLFLGPTGVGKTELARAVAELLFDDERAMVRLDMSEYMEKQATARLIGAPPGYIGYEEGGQLTEAVRRRPYCLVLLDEVEKAHPDVFDTLLQVLDDGRLTDSQGRTVDFSNVVMVMTSNLPGDPREFFRPEFVNRIDEVIRFAPLALGDVRRILDLQLAKVAERLAARRVTLQVTPRAKDVLAQLGYEPAFGARPIRRVLQHEISDRVAMAILDGRLQEGSVALVDVEPDGSVTLVAQASPLSEAELDALGPAPSIVDSSGEAEWVASASATPPASPAPPPVPALATSPAGAPAEQRAPLHDDSPLTLLPPPSTVFSDFLGLGG